MKKPGFYEKAGFFDPLIIQNVFEKDVFFEKSRVFLKKTSFCEKAGFFKKPELFSGSLLTIVLTLLTVCSFDINSL